jgi:hypothetical protein
MGENSQMPNSILQQVVGDTPQEEFIKLSG